MKLRSRIMIITFLIILFVQGLNCFLEIGFLANNLEENNLRKYRIIGNEIKRKLNISLIFGKTLAQLNYDKLLKNIIPEDIENLHIIDNTNRIVYSAKETAGHSAFRMATAFKREKDFESYTIFIPLSDREAVRGNLVLVVSTRETKDKLLSLVRSSVLNFLLILALSLPLLYGLLTWFINRPYKAYLNRIETCAAKCDFAGLKKEGIDLSPLSDAEETLRKLKKAQWLLPENQDLYGEIDDAVADREDGEVRVGKELMQYMNTN